MSLRRVLWKVTAAIVLCIGVSSAAANLVTFVVSGTVDFAPIDAFQVGDTITLTYTIDTSVPGLGTSAFAFFANVTSATVVVGGWSGSSLHGGVSQQGDHPGFDSYLVDSGPVFPASIDGFDLVYFQFELFDPTGTVVNDARIPVTHIDTLGDDNALWITFANADSTVAVHGIATSIGLVPEPSTVTLFAAAIPGLLSIAARRTRRRPAGLMYRYARRSRRHGPR